MSDSRVLRVRLAPPTEAEERLGAALERALAAGTVELVDLCSAVNADGLKDGAGAEWTPQSLMDYLARLP